MGGAIARLKAMLGMDAKQYKSGMRDAQGSTRKFQQSLASVGRALGAAFSVAALVQFSRTVIQWASDLSIAARNVGVLTSEMIALNRIAIQSGIGFSEMQRILSKLQQQVYRAAGGGSEGVSTYAKMFDQLGLSIQELATLDPAAMLERVSRAAFASGAPLQTLNELLGERLGANAMVALRAIAEEGIPGVSRAIGEAADEVEYYGSQWAKMWDQVKEASLGFWVWLSEKHAQTTDFWGEFFSRDDDGRLWTKNSRQAMADAARATAEGRERRQGQLAERRERREQERRDRIAAAVDQANAQATDELARQEDAVRKAFGGKIEGLEGRDIGASGRGVGADAMARLGGMIGANRGGVGIADRQLEIAAESAATQRKIEELTREMNEALQVIRDQAAGGAPQ